MGEIHIAGGSVQVGSRERQLCAWCGTVLEDVDHANIMVAPSEDGQVHPYSFWEPGSLVLVAGNMRRVVEHKDGDQLPTGCCANPKPKRHLRAVEDVDNA